MSETRVVHVSKEPYDVYIGRAMPRRRLKASKWANPYPVTKNRSRSLAIAMFCEYLRGSPDLMAAIPELHGKVLGCWCYPEDCHGNVLAALADQIEA